MSRQVYKFSVLELMRRQRHAVRVNPQFSNRMIEASRSVLNRYIPDIYLYSDVYKGEDSGKCVHTGFYACYPRTYSPDHQDML